MFFGSDEREDFAGCGSFADELLVELYGGDRFVDGGFERRRGGGAGCLGEFAGFGEVACLAIVLDGGFVGGEGDGDDAGA